MVVDKFRSVQDYEGLNKKVKQIPLKYFAEPQAGGSNESSVVYNVKRIKLSSVSVPSPVFQVPAITHPSPLFACSLNCLI